MKKYIVFIGIGILFLSGYFLYKYTFEEPVSMNSVYLIPRDAIYFVTSDTPIRSWKEVRDSKVWKHLQTNTYFAELTTSANTLDTILNENKKLLDFIGSKKAIISTHPISKRKYDYLFIIDLKKTAKLMQFHSILKKVFKEDYRITERKFKGVNILEFFDKKTRETLYLSVIDNNLIASYTHSLVEASISQLNEPSIGRDLRFLEINRRTKNNKLFRVFVQYNYVDEFVYMLTHTQKEWIQDMSKILVFSGFDIDLINGEKWIAKGFTNTDENSVAYLQALDDSGTGTQSIAGVAPQKTSMYLSLGFNDFAKFYKQYNELLKSSPEAYQMIQENTQEIETLLDISVRENFVDWIGDEIALLKLEPVNQSKNDDFALVIKTKDTDLARKNLNFIVERIAKKTPVKFKAIDYKGYSIKFMSIKGFFKLFFGGYFKELVTPYYTLIDDYVIFSNHPNTLKYIITNYKEENTLAASVNYKGFKDNFQDKSNLFVYVNTPMLYPSIVASVDAATQKQLIKNEAYFTSFSQMGVQLTAEDDVLKSKLVVQFIDKESRQYSDEFTYPSKEIITNKDEKPIVVIANQDPFDVIEINPQDLNTDEYVVKYKNGQIKVKVPIKNGMKNGMYRAYYKNGELYFKGRFKDDKRVGKWKKYDTEGRKILQIKY